jgi:hypothetical protein
MTISRLKKQKHHERQKRKDIEVISMPTNTMYPPTSRGKVKIIFYF